ncbi:MAG TPA: DUF6665 family protein [Kofleriaceae bacterium]|nr:DUF6665 family protein [Kofleriaceae bacterium]
MTVTVEGKDPFEALLAEFAREKAQALARIAARMEASLADLQAFDEERPPEGLTRQDVLEIAAESVWFYVVQREMMGWNRHEDALRFYGVPAEVRARIGPRPRRG